MGDVPLAQPPSIEDNTALHRFELAVNGETAFILYRRTGDALTLIHTEVPVALRGQHVGQTLVESVLRRARAEGLRIIPMCPFVQAYMRRHPES